MTTQAKPSLVAAIEAGGTKFVCALGRGPDELVAETRIPTTSPAATLGSAIDFFKAAEGQHGEKIAALGVATFGPADVNPASPSFGFITTTPKAGWARTRVLGALRDAFPVPAGFDTDVNGAALGEWRWGAGAGKNSVLYLTVGTGIGGGLCIGGHSLHGLTHPEMGHVLVSRPAAERAIFGGVCPFHGDCLEGIASGPALAARWGCPADSLPDDHAAWDLEVDYLASALCQFIFVASPEIIILGGGVGGRSHLLSPLRERVAARINGYVPLPAVVPPGLGSRSGLLGALALGLAALKRGTM
ncbi:MAG: ROK family protein [Verrucomicrobiales bacterium]